MRTISPGALRASDQMQQSAQRRYGGTGTRDYLHGSQTRRRRRRRRLSVSQLIRPTSDPSFFQSPSDPRRFPERV